MSNEARRLAWTSFATSRATGGDTCETGFIKTGPDLGDRDAQARLGWVLDRDPFLHETNIPCIFASGDVRSGSGKRVANAVREGSATISMVHRYLETV